MNNSIKKFISLTEVRNLSFGKDKLIRLTFFDRYLYRPIAHFFLPFLFNFLRLSPNQISILSLFSALASLIAFFNLKPYFGVFFLLIWAILDCADGSLARVLSAKYKIKNKLGEFFDAYAGYFVAGTIWFNIGNYLFLINNDINFLYLGLISSFLAVYARCSYLKINLVLLKNKNYTELNDDTNPRYSIIYKIYENLEFGSALPILILLSLILSKLIILLYLYLLLNIALFIWLQKYIYKNC